MKSPKGLIEQANLFKMLAESSSVGMAIFDENIQCIWTNQAMQSLGQFTSDQALGDGFFDLIHPDDKKKVKDRQQLFLGGSIQTSFKYRYLRNNHSQVLVQAEVNEILENKKRVGFSITAKDISEIGLLKDELKRSDDGLRSVITFLSDWVFIVDEYFRITWSHGPFLTKLNKNFEDFMGEEITTFLQPQNPEYFRQALYEARNGRTTKSCWKYEADNIVAHFETTFIPTSNHENNSSSIFLICKDISELKKLQKGFIEHHEIIDKIINSIPELIYSVDLNGHLTLTNDYFDRIISRTKDQLIGKKFGEIQPGRIADKFESDDQKIISTGQMERMELFLRGKNEKMHLFDVLKVPLFDHMGSVKGILGIGRNITKEREYEERFRVAIDFAHEIIIDWDSANRYIRFSKVFYSRLKYERGSLDGPLSKIIFNLIPRPDRQEFIKSIRLFVNSNEDTYERELKIKDKDGNWIWFMARGKVTRLSGSDRKKALIILIDITHIKNMQLELKDSNSQLNHLISSVPGIVFISKLNDRFTMDFISEKCYEITGYEASKFLLNQINFRSLIVENDRMRVVETIREAYSCNSGYEVRYRIRNKEGKEVWLWEKGDFITFNTKKEDPVFEGILMDITDLVEIEDRIISATLSAEDKERKRLALEIHDSVQQLLVSAMFHFKSIENQISTLDPNFEERYNDGLKLLEKGLEETRSISHNIMPRSIYDFGLVDTVEGLIYDLEKLGKLEVIFIENLDGFRLAENIELNLYRIIQEATNNILKYARASKVIIKITLSNNLLMVTIEDDGIGFDINTLGEYGQAFGIASMQSRTSAIYGKLNIATRIAVGTKISIEIPVNL